MKKKFIHYFSILTVLLLSAFPAFAQDVEPAGRAVTREDWVSFMPVFVGAIIVVIIVDAFFIIPIFRKNDDSTKDEA